MYKKMTIAGLLLMLCWVPLSSRPAAAQNEVRRSWSELPSIVGHQIALSLPDFTYIQGKALAIQADGLDIDVKKTSNSKLHPKGNTTIPRASVSVIEFQTKRYGRFPLATKVVGSAGAMGGLLLGSVIGNRSGNGNSILIGMGLGTVAGAVGGVALGRQLDKETETTLIRINPEPAANTSQYDASPLALQRTPRRDQFLAASDNSAQPPVNPMHEYESEPTVVLTTPSGNRLLRRGEKRKVDDAHWAGSGL